MEKLNPKRRCNRRARPCQLPTRKTARRASEPASIAVNFDSFITVYEKYTFLKFILLCHIFFISDR
ncbi:hypothetical protein FZI51_09740 [Cronobacter sakazakii]|nr:hypothetical protein FZI46_05965 [Cronobacter sakazakii]KAB1485965.1 hypothetical protein FZI51_09740 [Cronobacter sakazakii]KAB1502676.1 hypothetical protein FZH95_00125 [Cronobacter sakazakii]HAU5452927.1 hypothetical protein [Cronobacter sakazakii]